MKNPGSERVRSGFENCRRKGIKLERPANLTPEKEEKILEMKSQKIGLNKTSKEVGVEVRMICKRLSGQVDSETPIHTWSTRKTDLESMVKLSETTSCCG
jgi:DNA invertase Pin-like site-specific DNA recombinase